jgi:hypothetical protein
MALEIINDGTAHPTRLEAVLNFCNYCDGPQDIQAIGEATMPLEKKSERKMLNDVLKHLNGMGLIIIDGNVVEVRKQLTKNGIKNAITDKILRPSNGNNELFGTYYSWLLHHTGSGNIENFELLSGTEKAGQFNREMSPNSDERKFNDVKERGFRNWAVYLGLGYNIGSRPAIFTALPVTVIENNLLHIFSDCSEVSAQSFFGSLCKRVPFFDKGKIFLGVEKMVGELGVISPAVSSAVRILHDEKIIELIGTTDAPKDVRLHPNENHMITSSINSIKLLQDRN